MLSQIEANHGLAAHPVELGALARQVCAALAPAALQKNQRVALDAPLPCTVDGDEALLAVLMRNLLDNASRYSPRDASIELRLRRQGDAVTLDFEDSGPGMVEADITRIGQRFFRVLGHDAPGSGLGWSIVQRIAATHGATLQVDRSARLGGLRVQVRFAAGTAT
jgi:two-component system, OmpR family, sensor histidine kinase QseC